jgi:hypothetical protein
MSITRISPFLHVYAESLVDISPRLLYFSIRKEELF